MLLKNAVSEVEMARVAADVGYSESAFAVAQDDGSKSWRVRYFSPESEVPFCGHATIALGAALGEQNGGGTYTLVLSDATITVDARATPDGMIATLSSPPTKSRTMTEEESRNVMALFDLTSEELDPRLAPAHIHGGANHIVLPLKDRSRLAAMEYDLDDGRVVMRKHNLVTVMLVYIKANQSFVVRNAFASGGVLEDPAIGAAAAAFAGYLRDSQCPRDGRFTIRQGEDMGSPSQIKVSLDDVKGTSVRVSGSTRDMT
ncbi:PhzF family phenazine biosynthesis protein [uncultured Ruegeria sp.]|uniref:PhzF family phenazine biosynthesis protein n=1 Tax=uncultured Ruegeria sp. TaxID=259304 RepID=UPI0026367751|nr:PhzF family phenazine biosynthesis isomerase [uncultured Ruegeria sp.]